MSIKNRLSVRVLAVSLLAGGVMAPMVYGQNAGGQGAAQQDNQQGGGGHRPQAGFHLIPRFAEQQLDLTDDQKQQISDLEKETKAKLAKILTADQMKTLSSAHPPHPDHGGPGGDQGGPGGDQGGPGGPPGN